MRGLYFIIFILISVNLFAQHKSIPLHAYYKNEFLRSSKNKSITTFFPANESQLNLSDSIKDTSIFYYDLPVWFFQKHWLEINEPDGKIHISPLINLSLGKNLNPNDNVRLFRNTRGIYAEGELFKNISYNFLFTENQAVFMDYEAKYLESRGEYYVNTDSNYYQVNAVIPAGARTKPFKLIKNAYDYTFSIGSFAWNIKPKVRLEFGNNQHFIGVGYRSILLSDNAIHAPYAKLNWTLNEKWSYQFLIRKQQNLFRKPKTLGIESSYEKKFYSAAYLSYKPIEKLSFSLFTAGNQLRADSIVKHAFQWQMLVPILNNDLLYSSSIINGISGLNIDFSINNMRLYGQVAIDKVKSNILQAYQLGAYYFDLLGVKNLDFQLELNHIPQNFYASDNIKLAYSHFNLPSAHPKGNSFSEFITAVNFEKKRCYVNFMQLIYWSAGGTELNQFNENSIFKINSVANITLYSNGTTMISQGEIGYRINKKYNPTLFFQGRYRVADYGFYKSKNLMIMAGLKVNLFNQYLDF
jgi:hypothetical protein